MAVYVEKNMAELICPVDLYGRNVPRQSVCVPIGTLPRESAVFRRQLAQTAAVLSLSSMEESALAQNLRALGYSDLLAVRTEGEADKIGMFLASRVRGGTLETVVVLKGTEGTEWLSNFEIGFSAEHSGFGKAADFAEEQLGDYIFTRTIGTEPRFFVTGYSRGGAVANILAKRLCDRYGTDTVCAYTLASPAITISRRQARYNCIFNLVREEDLFTRIPPEGWGYTRYGKDHFLYSGSDIGDRCQQLTGEEYIGFTDRRAADSFVKAILRLAPNIHAYYKRRRDVGGRQLSLYDVMRSVADLTAGQPEEAGDLLLNALVSDYGDLLNLMTSGADIGELMTCTGTPRCSIADAHGPAAYLAAMEASFTD